MGWAQPIFFSQTVCRAMNLGELLEKTLPPMGYELVDWETSPKGRYVRVFIDKPKGVDVEDCARVSRHLTRLFAVENVDFDRLEVSSPGLDRPLRKAADFVRFTGDEAEFRLAESDRQRPAREGHPARPRGRRCPRRDRAGNEDDPARRHRSRAARTEDRVEKGDMNRELLLLVDALAREKNVPKDIVFTALESALASATKKRFADEIDARVSIDRETGDYESFRRWTVVPDEEHEEPAYQIAITDAAERDPALTLGDVVEEPLEPVEFGRIGAQAAKQVILQKIRDAEREQILNDFLERRGQPADRDGQAHRARQRDRRIGPHRGRDSARPADPEGDAARRRPRPRVRDQDRPHGEGTAAHPVADRAGVPDAAVRARGPGDRGGPDRDQGRGARPRHPREDRGQVERSRGSTRRAPASACAARA